MRATVLTVDRFGNLQLNLRRDHVAAVGLAPRRPRRAALRLDAYYAVVADTFADATGGELILYEDSYGSFAIAISGGDAAALTGAEPGDEVRISPAVE